MSSLFPAVEHSRPQPRPAVIFYNEINDEPSKYALRPVDVQQQLRFWMLEDLHRRDLHCNV